MYTAPIEEPRKPFQEGNIICEGCGAEFMPATEARKWLRGRYGGKNDTSGIFEAQYQIPDNACPMCETVFKVEDIK